MKKLLSPPTESLSSVTNKFVKYFKILETDLQNQKTSNNGNPMHTETGYIRVRSGDDGDHLEFLICDPTGISSIFEGSVVSNTDQEMVIQFASTNIKGTPSAKPVSVVQRNLTIKKSEPMKMNYQVNMKAMEQALQQHLSAELEKQAEPE